MNDDHLGSRRAGRNPVFLPRSAPHGHLSQDEMPCLESLGMLIGEIRAETVYGPVGPNADMAALLEPIPGSCQFYPQAGPREKIEDWRRLQSSLRPRGGGTKRPHQGIGIDWFRCSSPHTTHESPLAPLTTHHPPLTTHHLPLTTHHSSTPPFFSLNVRARARVRVLTVDVLE